MLCIKYSRKEGIGMNLIKIMDLKYEEQNSFYDIRDSNDIKNYIVNYQPYFVKSRISRNIKKEVSISSNKLEYGMVI